jgi:hypothetical protein
MPNLPVPPELEKMAAAATQTVLSGLREETKTFLRENKASIDSAGQELSAEMKRNQEALLAKLEAKNSKGWQVALALVPILATALLGLLVFRLQIGTNARIDRAGKLLSTRLALSQQFYLQRFNIYDDADKRMVQLLVAVRNLDRNRDDAHRKQQAVILLTQLNITSRTNSFYMTPKVSDGLATVWLVATQLPQLNNSGSKKIEDLDATIKNVEEQMRKELLVNIDPVDDYH